VDQAQTRQVAGLTLSTYGRYVDGLADRRVADLNLAEILVVRSEWGVPTQTKATLEHYERNLGVIPNFFSLIARSPDVLNAEANMQAVLGKSLGHDTRERLHIMTAEVNGCNYCLSVHSYVGGKFNHLSKEEMELNRQGHSTDPKADAALQFGYKVAKSRGHVTDADFEAVRAAGFTDEQIIDIVAETAFGFTTNLFNNTFKTDIDSIVPQLRTHYSETEAE
jgi:uncharacterized peroxidase-related enzyme